MIKIKETNIGDVFCLKTANGNLRVVKVLCFVPKILDIDIQTIICEDITIRDYCMLEQHPNHTVYYDCKACAFTANPVDIALNDRKWRQPIEDKLDKEGIIKR